MKQICRKCKQEKPLSEFWGNKRSANKKAYRCKECQTVDRIICNSKHKEARQAYSREYEHNRRKRPPHYNPNRHKATKLRQYGLTDDQYTRMLTDQNGLCKICKTNCSLISSGKLVIDHNHRTGKIRGLLCGSCNVMLGNARDSAEILRSGAEYLEQTSIK